MRTWRLEGCPKCKGFLMLEEDTHGFYEQCLQCGYTHDIPEMVKQNVKQAERKEKIVASSYTILNGSEAVTQDVLHSTMHDAPQNMQGNTDLQLILFALHERKWYDRFEHS